MLTLKQQMAENAYRKEIMKLRQQQEDELEAVRLEKERLRIAERERDDV